MKSRYCSRFPLTKQLLSTQLRTKAAQKAGSAAPFLFKKNSANFYLYSIFMNIKQFTTWHKNGIGLADHNKDKDKANEKSGNNILR